jgi:hypothetical protein
VAFNVVVDKENSIEIIVEDIIDEPDNNDDNEKVFHELLLEGFELV